MSNTGKTVEEIAFNTIVGKNIRYLRKSKKLSQSKVADVIGLSFQQVQKYEKGLNGLHSFNLHKIAHRVFNVSMDVLADPQMIIKHEGFKDKHESQEYRTLGTATPQDAGYLKPQNGIGSMEEITKDQMDAALDKAKAEGYLEPKVIVGSLEKIKDQLKKDGIDPEETILPTLRRAASDKIKNEEALKNLKRKTYGSLSFDASRYDEFEEEYPAPLTQLEHDPKMRATYDAIIDARKKRY